MGSGWTRRPRWQQQSQLSAQGAAGRTRTLQERGPLSNAMGLQQSVEWKRATAEKREHEEAEAAEWEEAGAREEEGEATGSKPGGKAAAGKAHVAV